LANTRDTQGWPPESTLDAGDADFADASGRYVSKRGDRWYDCDKCGFLYPASETIIDETTGLRVCLDHDYDKPDADDVRLNQTNVILEDSEVYE
jgi:hypothetical protein